MIGKKITLDEMLARAKKDNHTHDYVQANYAKVVAEVEAEYGPQVPAMILRRGGIPNTGRGGWAQPARRHASGPDRVGQQA
jgi:hypothetical protein